VPEGVSKNAVKSGSNWRTKTTSIHIKNDTRIVVIEAFKLEIMIEDFKLEIILKLY
jgi:hypothetical protein